MRLAWLLIAALCSPGLAAAQEARPGSPTWGRTWGQRLADSTIAEHPTAWNMRKSDGEYRWAYTQGLVGLGMHRLSRKHGERRYYAYMKAYVDHYVDAGGEIRTLAPDEFNLDSNVCRSAGLGGEPYRDGSYAYYVSTDVAVDDAHGVGAFLLASAEVE